MHKVYEIQSISSSLKYNLSLHLLDHQLPDHGLVEGPGLLRRGDDLLRGKQEPEQESGASILEHPVYSI